MQDFDGHEFLIIKNISVRLVAHFSTVGVAQFCIVGNTLDAVYPIVYLDCIVVKIRQDKKVINKTVYLSLGVNMEGHKELLGMWLSENERAKFWLNVLTELQNCGVKDILIACVDCLKGFPKAINTVFPNTQIQLCIVHMIRNSVKYVPWKDYKAVTTDLKQIYQSVT